MAYHVEKSSTGHVAMLNDDLLDRGLAVVAEDNPANARLLAEMLTERQGRSGWKIIERGTAYSIAASLLCIGVMLVLIKAPNIDGSVLRWAEYVLAVPVLMAGTWLAFSPLFSSAE